MKIYLESGRSHVIMVTPGAHHPDVSDWMDERGNPKRFDVKFIDGVAEIDKKLGEYMIEGGLANRTRLVRVRNAISRAFA